MKKREDNANLSCSFCGKSQKEVKKLIAGPTVYICDECIELCNDIIAEEYGQDEGARTVSRVPKPKEIWAWDVVITRRVNPRASGSYGLKHICEEEIGEYVANGELIVAFIHLGLQYKRIRPGSPNVHFNISMRWVREKARASESARQSRRWQERAKVNA